MTTAQTAEGQAALPTRTARRKPGGFLQERLQPRAFPQPPSRLQVSVGAAEAATSFLGSAAGVPDCHPERSEGSAGGGGSRSLTALGMTDFVNPATSSPLKYRRQAAATIDVERRP